MDDSIKSTKVSKVKMVKVEIQLNEKVVKIGLIAYNTSDHIKKIYTDMKKIKIIGDKVEPQDVKYFDKEGVALDQGKQFSNYFDPDIKINVVKIYIPQQKYDSDQATKKAEQFLKKNKQPKQQSQLLIKNIKKSLIYIKDQKYESIESNIQQLSEAIGLYSQLHKKILAQNNIYNHLIDEILFDKELNKDNFKLSQISEQLTKKIHQFIDKYNEMKASISQNQRNTSQDAQKINFDFERKLLQQNYLKQIQQQQNRYRTLQESHYQKIKQAQQDADNYYKDIIQKMERQILKFKDISNKVEKQRQEYSNQLLIENLELKKQLQGTENYCKYFEHFIDHTSIFNSIIINYEFTKQILQYFQKYCKKSLKNFNLLYRSKYQTITDRFIECLSQKSNIFLIAKTKQGTIFGGYTSSILKKWKNNKLKSEKIQNQKSFLFTTHRNEINFFPLKTESSNFQCDNLFISFGAEEISIDRFEMKVESIFVTGDQNQLNYSDINKKRKFFLSNSEDWSGCLQVFQIYSVNIA